MKWKWNKKWKWIITTCVATTTLIPLTAVSLVACNHVVTNPYVNVNAANELVNLLNNDNLSVLNDSQYNKSMATDVVNQSSAYINQLFQSTLNKKTYEIIPQPLKPTSKKDNLKPLVINAHDISISNAVVDTFAPTKIQAYLTINYDNTTAKATTPIEIGGFLDWSDDFVKAVNALNLSIVNNKEYGNLALSQIAAQSPAYLTSMLVSLLPQEGFNTMVEFHDVKITPNLINNANHVANEPLITLNVVSTKVDPNKQDVLELLICFSYQINNKTLKINFPNNLSTQYIKISGFKNMANFIVNQLNKEGLSIAHNPNYENLDSTRILKFSVDELNTLLYSLIPGAGINIDWNNQVINVQNNQLAVIKAIQKTINSIGLIISFTNYSNITVNATIALIINGFKMN